MRYPWANTALLLLLVAMLATGLGGLVGGEPAFGWVLWLHGVGGYAIVAALVWKARIIGDVPRRRPVLTPTRLAFLLLTGLLLATLLTGYLGPTAGVAPSAITACWSFMARWRQRSSCPCSGTCSRAAPSSASASPVTARPAAPGRPRRRRPARAADGRGRASRARCPGAHRRFTGSYETGSLTGRFPEVAWLADNPAPADVAGWRLTVEGAVARPLTLDYDDLTALADDASTDLIDCTGGWYSTQAWGGVRLGRLLALAEPTPAALSVTVEFDHRL